MAHEIENLFVKILGSSVIYYLWNLRKHAANDLDIALSSLFQIFVLGVLIVRFFICPREI